MVLSVLALWLFTFHAHANCMVAIPDDCPVGKVCAKYNNAGDTQCFDVPAHAPIEFSLPFDAQTSVVCAQSGRFSAATHTFRNMLYAIDLATPYDRPASTVLAAADGVAYVHGGCADPVGKPEQTKTDGCGLGYGNHVWVLHEKGYASLYAHLSGIRVKTGERVRRHQPLGTEGATGQAAYRHLHWDVHLFTGGPEDWAKTLSKPGWGGVSVPYRFTTKVNGFAKVVDSSAIACRWLDMKQPLWSGI